MPNHLLKKLKDSDLNEKIKTLAEKERLITQEVVEHIAEVDRPRGALTRQDCLKKFLKFLKRLSTVAFILAKSLKCRRLCGKLKKKRKSLSKYLFKRLF